MGLKLDVLVGGTRSAVLSDRVRSLTVTDGRDYSQDSAALSLSAPAPAEIEVPPLGAELRFAVDGAYLGGPLRARAIHGDSRAGAVTVEAAALDPLTTLRERRLASWSGKSVAEIAAAIADRAGLVHSVSPALGSIVPAGAIQSDESDEQFFRDLVERLDGQVVHKFGRLIVLAADEATSVSGEALPPVEIDLREEGAWVRWRRVDTAIVDVVQATYLEADGSTSAYLTLGDQPQGRRTVYGKLPGLFASKSDAEAAIRRKLAGARAGVDYLEVRTSLKPEAKALYPATFSGVPQGFPAQLNIHQVRHELGRRVATTTITARP